MTNKIMLVDDEPDILDLLEKSLNLEGFHNITKIDNGFSAVETCRKVQPDIIILDVMLPDIDGYEVCKQIREFSHCPILFLSAKNDELDKILGLAVGGDDYVTKPFSPKEVAYRVKAQLRRLKYKQSPTQNYSIKIGELMIDTDGCRVMKKDREIELTAREFEILKHLAENMGRVISRERLYETVWGDFVFTSIPCNYARIWQVYILPIWWFGFGCTYCKGNFVCVADSNYAAVGKIRF